jgi:8-oxo-dGTP diphosphatase
MIERKNFYMKPKKESVNGIIFSTDSKDVLLVKRRDVPVWVLPGGGIDPMESPEEAVIREVYEETGYIVEISRKIAEYIPVNRFTTPTHFFECRIVSGEAKSSSETKDVKFFPVNSLPRLIPPTYRNWIEDAKMNLPYLIQKKVVGASFKDFLQLVVKHPICVGRFFLTRMGLRINS